jgi:hypothetical protein
MAEMSELIAGAGVAGPGVATEASTGASPVIAAEHGPPPAVPEFEVVPRIGLVLSAIVLVGLVVVVATNSMWPLEFVHVTFGAGWTVVDLFVGLLVGPIIGRMSIPARVEFTTRFMPKMVVLMPTIVTATLVSGWQLATKLGTNLTYYPNHSWVVASMIVVGVMSLLALGLLEPANIAVLVELKKPRPDGMVIEKLMKRFVYCAGALGGLQIATFVIMTKLASG